MRRRELLGISVGLLLGCRGATRSGAAEQGPRRGATERELDREPAASADPRGPLDAIPLALRPAFDPRGHAPAPARLAQPDPDEPPQPFSAFVAERPRRPAPGEVLAILPIGEYPRGWVVEYDRVHQVRSPEPALLAEFCEAWFGLPTRVLPAVGDDALESMPTRERDGRRQLDAEALLDWVAQRRPADSFAILALTLEDLYQPGAAWVFGLASIAEGVGVHSMLRYDPGFVDADARPPDHAQIILARALRVVAHEAAHMLGLRHCGYWACIMNPTAGLADLDAVPLRLCPVCLRKLWTATGVDLAARWRALAAWAEGHGLDTEARWFAARLRSLEP